MAKVKSDSLAIDVVFEKERLEKEGLDKDERYEEVSALAETKIEEGKEDEEDEYADDSSGGGEYSEDGDEDTSGGDDDYSEESDGEESETDDDGEPEPEEGGDEDAKAAEKGDDSDGDGKDDFGEEDSGEVNVVISESYYRRKRISLDGHAGYDRLVYPYSRFGIENQFVGYNGIAAGWRNGLGGDDDPGEPINWGEEISGFYDKIKEGAGNTKEFLKEYGGPLVENISAGTSKVLGVAGVALFGGIAAISRFREDSHRSYESLKKEIDSLNAQVDRLSNKNTSSVLRDKDFSNRTDIAALTIKSKVDIANNLKVLKNFQSSYFRNLDEKVKTNIVATQSIIQTLVKSDVEDASKYLHEDPGFPGFSNKETNVYRAPSEDMQVYIYKDTLPGDRLLVGYFPKDNTNDSKAVVNAYANSKLFLGMDNQDSHVPQKIPLVEKRVLKDILSVASDIVEMGIKSTDIYDQVVKERKGIKMGFKNFLKTIADSSEKKDQGKDVSSYVAAKAEYIDKTFIGGSMKVHGYISNTVESSLEYVIANIKALT